MLLFAVSLASIFNLASAETVTVIGTVHPGVEAGCWLIRADGAGTEYLLIGTAGCSPSQWVACPSFRRNQDGSGVLLYAGKRCTSGHIILDTIIFEHDNCDLDYHKCPNL